MSTASLHTGGLRPQSQRRQFRPGGRSGMGAVSIAVMVGVHGLIGYALVSGLARQAMEVAKRPLMAALIEEVPLPPPPPPPPPPPKRAVEPPRSTETPPPAYVPPPDLPTTAAATAEPAITAVQSTVAEAPPAAAPPAAPVVTSAPARQDIAVVCPRQSPPEIPARALDEGIGGKVRAELRIRGGRVVDVQLVSGPRVFFPAIRAAVQKYQCVSKGADEIVATQEFEFVVE